MAETIVLDPTEVAVSRTQVDITPWVKGDGIDWGDAEIAAYMADQARGASPVDFRVPNRVVTIPLVLKGVGGTSFATARTTVQAKAALFQREGGWLKRLTSSGSIVFADVVSATLKLGGGWMQAHRSADLDAQLTLDVLPDFYGAEVTLPDHSTTTATELVFTETGILGDYPARCRIVVDEDDGDRQLGLLWGLRSRNYDSAATARLAYNAGTLTPQDVATSPGFGVMRHTSVSSMWTPILKTDIIPSGALTHVGTYRVWVQIDSVGTTERGVDVRLVWDVGDLSTPVINATKRIPGADSFYTLDLGEVRLDRAKSGTHRWQGQIQAKATTVPADVIISKVWIVPVDDGYGVLRAPLNSAASFNAFTVRDEFNQTSGALHGKTVQVGGGTWATFANGAASDFQATGTPNFWINRTSTAEQWRGAVAGSASLADVVAQMDFHWSVIDLAAGNDELALFARRINQDNFIAVNVIPSTGAVALRRYSSFSGGGGSYTILDSGTLGALAPDSWYTLRLYVDTTGLVAGWVGSRGSSFGDPLLVGRTVDAVTGGALATGTTGLFEYYGSAVASVRTYDSFLAYPPATDAVLHPSQSAELRTEGLYREDATGTSYAPVPFPTYDYPRLPPAGLEGRTCEVFIKDSRGDFDLLPDTATDDISARIFYRPCWLFVP